MPSKVHDKGITFAVADVERAATLLPTSNIRDAISYFLADQTTDRLDAITQWSSPDSKVLTQIGFHPLIAATHLAFSQHRPLVLAPDMIWITIVQGLAQHVKNNSEKLRHKFVQHKGKMLKVAVHEGLSDDAWQRVVQDLSAGVQQTVGIKYNELICDFSTTGDVERIACQVALLDVFEPYFEYAVMCICGIPEITLEGTPADWARLREKVEFLADYDLDFWLVHLREITDQFERASRGDIDIAFWEDIYKQKQAYGWDRMNGWMLKLIPYTKCYSSGSYTKQNPLFTEDLSAWNKEEKMPFFVSGGVTSEDIPGGIAQAPFKLYCDENVSAMEFLGGFVGVEQDANTFALRPKIGWAVRYAPAARRVFEQLWEESAIVPALEPIALDAHFARLIKANTSFGCLLSADFILFYKTCNGINFSGLGSNCRILGIDEIEYEKVIGKAFLRFCDLGDGTHLNYSMDNGMVSRFTDNGKPLGEVEPSFQECLKQLFASNGKWIVDYGAGPPPMG